VKKLKITTKGRYGLRALIDLAQYSEIEPVSINSIATRQGISERYLEQLMTLLKKAGLIKSIRGAGGGYVLAKAVEEISVGDVLRALEGSLEPVECAAFSQGDSCEAAGGCVTKYVWKRINESINRTVNEISLKQLVEESRCVQNTASSTQMKCNN
jgi:Rrf2 family protein